MEGQSKILWDFLETAFRAGTLDEILLFSKTVTDKKYEDQALVYADLEDSIDAIDDFSTVDKKLDTAYLVMKELNDEEILEGIKILLVIVTPLMKRITDAADRDMENMARMKTDMVDNLRKVGKALSAIISISSRSLVSDQSGKHANEYGHHLGKTLNSTISLVNNIHAKDSDAISDFMSGAFNEVDHGEMRKTLDILADAFLDQKPQLFRWMASTMAKRARKRLLSK